MQSHCNMIKQSKDLRFRMLKYPQKTTNAAVVNHKKKTTTFSQYHASYMAVRRRAKPNRPLFLNMLHAPYHRRERERVQRKWSSHTRSKCGHKQNVTCGSNCNPTTRPVKKTQILWLHLQSTLYKVPCAPCKV
jgi:hypothetical protein